MSRAALPLAPLFGALALVPVILGPLPAHAATITARLCNGGTVTIPIGQDEPQDEGNCHPKGCHAGTCRSKDEPKRPNRAN
ncbi:MAG: hypothetical protein ACKO1N_11395 [Erythrobacter sp.]